MKIRLCCLLQCMWWGAVAVSLATGEPVWSWEDCLHEAALHNPQLAGADARLQAAEAGRGVARSALRPQVGAGAGAERRGVRDNISRTTTEFRTTVGVDQLLYTGGRLTAGVREASAAKEVSEAMAWGVAAEVTFALRAAFIELLHAQEEQQLLEQVEQRRQNNLQLVELLYDGGKEHKGSLAVSAASLFQATTDVRLVARRIAWARSLLQRTTGLETIHDDLTVAGELAVLPPPSQVDWHTVVERTPEYARAAAERRAGAARVERARSGRRPDITVSGQAGRFGDHDAFERDQWQMGVAIAYPFWPGGRHRHEVAQARYLLNEIEFALVDIRQQVRLLLEERLHAYRNAIDHVEVRQRFLDASELRAEIARQQYTSGLLSFEDWSRIENDLIDNQRLVLSAMQAAMLAEARWLRAAGTTAFESITPGDNP